MAYRDKLQERGNVEDRRGRKSIIGGGVGLVGVVIVLAVGYFAGPEEAMQLRDGLQQIQVVQESDENTVEDPLFAGEDSYEIFVSKIIGSTNSLWKSEFNKKGNIYLEPKLVLFRGATRSACGGAVSQAGPHYCPLDQTIYIDETFFAVLEQKFGAQGGDLAQAYVVAHEVGHHVQQQLGIINEVGQRVQGGDNDASIQLELQADCLAGMWIGVINEDGVLEKNDLYEAIDAAEAVGDDSIQEKTQGSVHPETRTHGSSVQRKQWLSKGYTEKNFEACNTGL